MLAAVGRHGLAVYGGVGLQPQINRLSRGVDVLVATVGRVVAHVRDGALDLSRVRHVVLDEADEMLDMGFLPDVERIVALVPTNRQTMLF